MTPGIKVLEEKILALEKESADHRQVEASLRQSESLFRTLAEQSFAGIYVVQDGKFKYVNSNAAFYAGLPESSRPNTSAAFDIHSLFSVNIGTSSAGVA